MQMAVVTSLKVSTVSYAIVYVKNAQQSLAFYRDVLGLKVKVDSPDWVELETGATTVALHSEDRNKPITRGNNTVLVFTVEDVFAAHEALKAAGARVTEAPKVVCETPTGTGYSLEFVDADGNLLSLYSEKQK
jgi:lactoylglutathione lyase